MLRSLRPHSRSWTDGQPAGPGRAVRVRTPDSGCGPAGCGGSLCFPLFVCASAALLTGISPGHLDSTTTRVAPGVVGRHHQAPHPPSTIVEATCGARCLSQLRESPAQPAVVSANCQPPAARGGARRCRGGDGLRRGRPAPSGDGIFSVARSASQLSGAHGGIASSLLQAVSGRHPSHALGLGCQRGGRPETLRS